MPSPASFRSPNYPAYYGQRKECVWNLQTNGTNFLSINFTDFDLAPGVKVMLYMYYIYEISIARQKCKHVESSHKIISDGYKIARLII